MVIGVIFLCLLTGWITLRVLLWYFEKSEKKSKDLNEKTKKKEAPNWLYSLIGIFVGLAMIVGVMYLLNIFGVPI